MLSSERNLIGRCVQVTTLALALAVIGEWAWRPGPSDGAGGGAVIARPPDIDLPPLVLSDDFDGPDRSGLGGGSVAWTLTGSGWRIASGRAVQGADPGGNVLPDALAVAQVPVLGQIKVVQARFLKLSDGTGVVFRYQDPLNHWRVVAYPAFATWSLERVTDGTVVEVQKWGLEQVRPGVRVTVEILDDQIRLWAGSDLVGFVSDPTLKEAPGVGLLGRLGASGTWDEFRTWAGQEPE